jgi:hypothetical protein
MAEPNGKVVEIASSKSTSIHPKPTAEEMKQQGVPDTLPAGWWMEFPLSTGQGATRDDVEARSKALRSTDELIEMRAKDGTARALLRLFQLPIIGAMKKSEWVAPDNQEGMEQEVEFANQMFDLPQEIGGMTQSKTRFIREALLGLFEGFSVFEEVKKVPKDGPLKNKWVIDKFAHLDSRTVRFLVSKETGGFNGIRQIAQKAGEAVDIIIRPKSVWYWAANEEENPFYGVSYFEAAWYHWDIKRKLYYIAHQAGQASAVAARKGTIPRQASPAEVNKFQQALANFAVSGSITFPEGFLVDLLNVNTGYDFLGLINHQNAEMAKSVLAPFANDDQRDILIDNSTADASTDFFVMSLESVMDEVAESLTRYVMPKYIDWNFGTNKYPEFRFGALSDPARATIQDLLTAVAVAQTTQLTPEFIREMEKRMADALDLEIDYEEIDKREEEQQAQMKADEQAQRDFQQQYFQQHPPAGPATPLGSQDTAPAQTTQPPGP